MNRAERIVLTAGEAATLARWRAGQEDADAIGGASADHRVGGGGGL